MKYYLVYQDVELGKAWHNTFGSNLADVGIVEIDRADITTGVECDAIVSPANSFGCMDGSLDKLLIGRFGQELQEKLQHEISLLPEKELLVGKALVIETGDQQIPYLISAPTMRVPMRLNPDKSVNPYLATKAALIVAQAHPSINLVAFPGMGTGIGNIPPDIAAWQMQVAFGEVLFNKPSLIPMNFRESQYRHQRLLMGMRGEIS